MYKDDRNLNSYQNSMNEQRIYAFLEYIHLAKTETERLTGHLNKPVVMISKVGVEYFFPYHDMPEIIAGCILKIMPEEFDDGYKVWGYIIESDMLGYRGPLTFIRPEDPDGAA